MIYIICNIELNMEAEVKKFIMDLHTHTIASGHAYNTINEMIHSAADKKLEILGITEHGPAMPGSCQSIYFHNLKALQRKKYGVKLLFGCEVNIINYDGEIDIDDVARNSIDVGIASMHIPCIKPGSVEENTLGFINAMKHKCVNIIGHPDDARYPVDYMKLVKAAKDNHVLLELNNSSLNPNGFRKNANENDRIMLKACMEYGQPIIVDSDSHVEEGVAEFGFAMELIKDLEFPEELIVNNSCELLKEYVDNCKF